MSYLRGVSIAFVLWAGSLSCTAQAADKTPKDKPGITSVEGKVSTEKKDTDVFTSIKIKNDKGEVFNITLDEKGKEVGKSYDSIRVLVKGKVEEKGTEKWLTVTQIGENKKKKK